MKKPTAIDAEELDRRFGEGVDITEYLDLSTERRSYGPGGGGEKYLRPVQLKLTPGHFKDLERLAADKGVSPAELVEKWLTTRLERSIQSSQSTNPSEKAS